MLARSSSRCRGQVRQDSVLMDRAKSLLDATSSYRKISTLQNSRLFVTSRSQIGKSTRSYMVNWRNNCKYMALRRLLMRIRMSETPCSVLSSWLRCSLWSRVLYCKTWCTWSRKATCFGHATKPMRRSSTYWPSNKSRTYRAFNLSPLSTDRSTFTSVKN